MTRGSFCAEKLKLLGAGSALGLLDLLGQYVDVYKLAPQYHALPRGTSFPVPTFTACLAAQG